MKARYLTFILLAGALVLGQDPDERARLTLYNHTRAFIETFNKWLHGAQGCGPQGQDCKPEAAVFDAHAWHDAREAAKTLFELQDK